MQTARRARLTSWKRVFTVFPWMLGLHASLCCQSVAAENDSTLPQVPEAKSPIELEQPIVITTPGHKRLNRDCRAKGTAIYIAAPNVTLDLNGHTIYYGSDNYVENVWQFGPNGRHGVVLWSYYNTEISIPGATASNNVTIKNGSIIDEGTAGGSCNSIGHE